ncbi:hypothetical protein DFJ74DRAFT_663992 [Hyaloraphidium curvatum]|nr:hypothetical protein DFJ74DRAFT_663992 [Hyaloraphidium curvatum]
MPVRILASINVKPGSEAALIAEFGPMCKASRAEPGCREYTLTQDQEKSTVFWVVEMYDDDAAIQAHFDSEHFKGLGPKIGPLLDGAPTIHRVNIVV